MHHEDVGHTDQRSINRSARGAVLGLLTVALLALLPAAAHATASLNVAPNLPTPVSVGSTGAGSIDVTNANSGGDVSSTICNFGDPGSCTGSQGIILVPSCGSQNFSASCVPPPTGADPGVFAIQSPASGAAGSACEGRLFTVTQIDATFGTMRFTPTTGANIMLPVPGSTCRINFTFTVVKSPVIDARVAPGRQTLNEAEAAALSNLGTPTFSRAAGAPVTVTLAAPALMDTDPDSPANNATPRVKGTAAAGTQTVALYTDAACSGPIAAQGTAAAFAAPGLAVVVLDDTTTTFHAIGTDSDGGITPCSSGLTYVEDSTPPGAPVPNDTDPDSPANDNLPRIKGTAAPGSIVKIYTDASCATLVAQGTAAAFASPGVTAAVGNDSTTTFRAIATDLAGNASSCSATAITYVEDSTPPAGTSVPAAPGSPSSDNAPRVTVTALPGTTVKIYTDPACAGTVAASGSAALFAHPGLPVTVPSNSTTRFYATASDPAGNASPCSAGSAAYVEDSLAPAVPSLGGSEPSSPAIDNNPRIKGDAESGSTVRLYTDAACAGAVEAVGNAADYASPGLLLSVADDSTTTYYVRATDDAGNASDCSGASTYVEDSRAPLTTIDNTPATGSTPRFTFASSEAGSTFECRIDAVAFAACTSPYTVAAGLPAGAHTFEVRAVDAAGNRAPGVVRGFTVGSNVTPPPPPATAQTPAQVGCLGIKGTVYVGTPAANSRTGAAKTDIMFGLAGNDTLGGASGVDCLYGGDGRDLLRGGAGADRLFGGTGNDRLDGQSGNDRLSGEAGNDRLLGGTGNDSLTGAAGRDTLTDRRGRDRLSGGAGNDTIDARDATLRDRRSADRIVCGAGRDRVNADPRDTVARNCERVVKRSLRAVSVR
ncbi:MAG TPA: hypothetical protein VGO80_13595 [Solirubrobacteraceae bacterium]|jgi:hypothetical protein|nr:hypothetical protein [Solirubrobacteraceae bacterium]